ncbi:hypothetical protein PUN28_002533 [Cardiocondyla obscurior]|uniref:Uncharacterized protein n=1 Tax=Cardiocondyla obscurior TaxID=286306 RepID=A0AAW2GUR0_9HYME
MYYIPWTCARVQITLDNRDICRARLSIRLRELCLRASYFLGHAVAFELRYCAAMQQLGARSRSMKLSRKRHGFCTILANLYRNVIIFKLSSIQYS